MALTPEYFLNAHKANLATLFGLSSKAYEGVEKMVELNMAASRAALNEFSAHAQALAGAKDLQEVVNLQTAYLQPLPEKAAAYGRHCMAIASGTGSELQKSVESKTSELQQSFNALVEATTKNAPAGSETTVAMMKSAMSAATNAYDSVQKAVKQATDMAEANIKAATATATSK